MAIPLLALLVLLAACSNHRVSPFPPPEAVGQILRPGDDLAGQLARATREAQASRLREVRRVEGQLAGGDPFVAIGYEGSDIAGQPVSALRVVTPAAIVLALGPARVARGAEGTTSELLPSLLPGGGFPSGKDWTGDRAPDLAVRAPDGSLAVYRVELMSAAIYPVVLRSPPTRVLDVNEDGRPDLAGAPSPAPGDPIAPDMVDVAVADGIFFHNDHPAALAFHRRLADAPLPDGATTVRLKTALEKAFHALCAGDPLAQAMQPATAVAAAAAPLADGVATSYVRWRGWLADMAASGAKTP